MFRQISFKKATAEQKMFILILVTVFVFAVMGSIALNTFNFKIAENGDFLKQYFNITDAISLNGRAIFIESLVKYCKYIIIIWILGFIGNGAYLVYPFLAYKGFQYGFSVSYILKMFGQKGIVVLTYMNLLQNVFMLMVYIIISFYSIKYMLRQKKPASYGITEYLLIFIICLSISLLVALFETVITPVFIRNLIQ